MIPKECKRLAKVDFAIAEVSECLSGMDWILGERDSI